LSSKCLQSLHTTTSCHEKAATRGQTVKYWLRHRQKRELKVHARDALLASVMFAEGDQSEEGVGVPPLKQRSNKKLGPRDKARQQARDAKERLRCYWPADEHGSMVPPSVDAAKKEAAKKVGCAAPSPGTSSSAPSWSNASSPFVVVQTPPSLASSSSSSSAWSSADGTAKGGGEAQEAAKRQKVTEVTESCLLA